MLIVPGGWSYYLDLVCVCVADTELREDYFIFKLDMMKSYIVIAAHILHTFVKSIEYYDTSWAHLSYL